MIRLPASMSGGWILRGLVLITGLLAAQGCGTSSKPVGQVTGKVGCPCRYLAVGNASLYLPHSLALLLPQGDPIQGHRLILALGFVAIKPVKREEQSFHHCL